MNHTGSTFMERSSYAAIAFQQLALMHRSWYSGSVLSYKARCALTNSISASLSKNIDGSLLFLYSYVVASTTNGTWACKLPECYRSTVPESRRLCSKLCQNSCDMILLPRLALVQAKLNQCLPRHLNACGRIWLIRRRKKNARSGNSA